MYLTNVDTSDDALDVEYVHLADLIMIVMKGTT